MVNERTQEYLRSFGLDPYRILENDWTREGYWEVSEPREIVDDELKVRWVDWPDGFDTSVLHHSWMMDHYDELSGGSR